MTTVHDATDADYIVTAVLLASHMRGNSKVIQEWSDGFKEGVPTTCLSTTTPRFSADSAKNTPDCAACCKGIRAHNLKYPAPSRLWSGGQEARYAA